MSINLTIPAAVWACKVDGVPLVAGVVEGECPIGCAYDGTGRGKHGMFCSAAGSKPPVDLVALRDARCESPDGYVENWDTGELGKCPRCVDGRLLVDVRVECDCDGGVLPAGTVNPKVWGGQPAPCDTICPEDCDDGVRTVKGLVDVVRIDEVYDGFDLSGATALLSSEIDTSSIFAVLAPAHVEALGTIQPGQWAWTFTEVPR